MARAKTTIEEMEEYEHLIEAGITVFAGLTTNPYSKRPRRKAT